MKKLQIFELARQTRDSYRDFYEKNEKARQDAIRKIKTDFRPGTRMQEELRAVREKYDKRLDDTRSKLRFAFDAEITKESAEQLGKIGHVPADSMKSLAALSDIPLSQAELEALLDFYANKNPWTNKQLEQLAERNNLSTGKRLDPPVDAVLSVLKDLEEGIHAYLEKHDDSFSSVGVDTSVSDKNIFNKEQYLYSRGTDPALTPKETAERYLSAVVSANNIAQSAQALGNALRHADSTTKTEMIRLIADGKYRINDALFSIIPSLSEEVAHDAENIKGASEVVTWLRDNPSSWYDASIRMEKAGGAKNPYLREFVEREFGDALDSNVKNAMDALNLPALKDAQNNQTVTVSGGDSGETAPHA